MQGPFVAGKAARGNITYPGYEHLVMEVTVVKVEPEKLFAFTWHPYAVDSKKDYSQETPTLVEFRLERTATGTLLRVSESGFTKIPSERQLEAFRKNENGWEQQMTSIGRYVSEKP